MPTEPHSHISPMNPPLGRFRRRPMATWNETQGRDTEGWNSIWWIIASLCFVALSSFSLSLATVLVLHLAHWELAEYTHTTTSTPGQVGRSHKWTSSRKFWTRLWKGPNWCKHKGTCLNTSMIHSPPPFKSLTCTCMYILHVVSGVSRHWSDPARYNNQLL